jgi:hypothetical protein
MPARTPSRAGAAAAALLACGCHTFRAVSPLGAGDGQTTLQAVAMQVPAAALGEEAVLTLDVIRADRRRLAEARLATRSEPQCRGGVAARSVRLRGGSGQELPTRTLGGGARSVDLHFGRDELSEALGREPAFVDLRLLPEDQEGPETCLRLPLVPAPDRVSWVEAPLWDVGAGGRLLWLPTPSHGLGWGWLVVGSGGLFLGPIRLGIEAGGGGGEPRDGTAGRSYALYGGALKVDGLLASLPAGGAGRLGLEGQAGWDLWFTEGQKDYLGTALGTGASWTFNGPRVALRFVFLPAAPDWSGFYGRRDASALGLELYAARWSSSGADAAWVLGLGLSGHMAL